MNPELLHALPHLLAANANDPFSAADSYGQALVRMLLSLGGLVLLLILAAKVLPKLMPGTFKKLKPVAPSGLIQLLDICPLNPQSRLYLVQVRQQQFLICLTDKGASLVGEVKPESSSETLPNSLSEPAAMPESFTQILRATKSTPDR